MNNLYSIKYIVNSIFITIICNVLILEPTYVLANELNQTPVATVTATAAADPTSSATAAAEPTSTSSQNSSSVNEKSAYDACERQYSSNPAQFSSCLNNICESSERNLSDAAKIKCRKKVSCAAGNYCSKDIPDYEKARLALNLANFVIWTIADIYNIRENFRPPILEIGRARQHTFTSQSSSATCSGAMSRYMISLGLITLTVGQLINFVYDVTATYAIYGKFINFSESDFDNKNNTQLKSFEFLKEKLELQINSLAINLSFTSAGLAFFIAAGGFAIAEWIRLDASKGVDVTTICRAPDYVRNNTLDYNTRTNLTFAGGVMRLIGTGTAINSMRIRSDSNKSSSKSKNEININKIISFAASIIGLYITFRLLITSNPAGSATLSDNKIIKNGYIYPWGRLGISILLDILCGTIVGLYAEGIIKKRNDISIINGIIGKLKEGGSTSIFSKFIKVVKNYLNGDFLNSLFLSKTYANKNQFQTYSLPKVNLCTDKNFKIDIGCLCLQTNDCSKTIVPDSAKLIKGSENIEGLLFPSSNILNGKADLPDPNFDSYSANSFKLTAKFIKLQKDTKELSILNFIKKTSIESNNLLEELEKSFSASDTVTMDSLFKETLSEFLKQNQMTIPSYLKEENLKINDELTMNIGSKASEQAILPERRETANDNTETLQKTKVYRYKSIWNDKDKKIWDIISNRYRRLYETD